MIINHRYKFIFIKTRKTAGTSVEIALSKFCDGDDIVTPISPVDEAKRQQLGYPGAANYGIAKRYYSKLDWLKLGLKFEPKRFFNHAPAEYIRDHIDPDIWNSYYKFSIERNPFDKAISRYFWSTREPRPTMLEFFNTAPIEFITNWGSYTIADHIVADKVARFEHLADDLATIGRDIGLPEPLSLPMTKGGSRKNREHYSHVLNGDDRARIERVCAKEIAAFGYQWTDASD
ncbi:MAG: hypothetical protein AAFO81_00655 [Pseudomonadota bacterium]